MQVCPYCLTEIKAKVFFTEISKAESYDCCEAICVNQNCTGYGQVVESLKKTVCWERRRMLDG
jgi:hypothetical protein